MEHLAFSSNGKIGMVIHSCNSISLEAKTGRSLQIWEHFGLHSEYKSGLNYIMTPCLWMNDIRGKSERNDGVNSGYQVEDFKELEI